MQLSWMEIRECWEEVAEISWHRLGGAKYWGAKSTRIGQCV